MCTSLNSTCRAPFVRNRAGVGGGEGGALGRRGAGDGGIRAGGRIGGPAVQVVGLALSTLFCGPALAGPLGVAPQPPPPRRAVRRLADSASLGGGGGGGGGRCCASPSIRARPPPRRWPDRRPRLGADSGYESPAATRSRLGLD